MNKFPLFFLLPALASCDVLYDSSMFPADKLITIPLDLTTHLGDKQAFTLGDDIQFLLSLGSDAYIYMYHIDGKKNITQILPSKNQHSNHYSAGYFLTLPEYEEGYRFKVSEPLGEEAIWVIASDQLIAMNSLHKSIAMIRQEIKQHSQQEYGEFVLNIVTAP